MSDGKPRRVMAFLTLGPPLTIDFNGWWPRVKAAWVILRYGRIVARREERDL